MCPCPASSQPPGLVNLSPAAVPPSAPPFSARSSLYTWKHIITVLATGCGPLLSLLLFWRLGNQWEAAACRHVLLWGLGLMATPLAMLCFFDDSRALGQHSDPVRWGVRCFGKLWQDATAGRGMAGEGFYVGDLG